MIWFYKFNIQLKPHETALELFAPSWDDAKKTESYQNLIADHQPRSLRIVEHPYWYHDTEEQRAALPEEIEQWTKNNVYLQPRIEALQPIYSYRYFGDENVLASLREKLTADYNENLSKWKSAYEKDGSQIPMLGEMCVMKTVYRNLVNCGHAYLREYMAALAREEHPLWILSDFYEKSGVFRIEPATEELLDILTRCQNDLKEETAIDLITAKQLDHSKLMELLDGNLEREFADFENKWNEMDFDSFCKNEMEIYTIQQFYHTLRFEKNLYSEGQLDIVARLKYPIAYAQDQIIGERDLCELSMGEIEDIFPQMYPDIMPEPDIWHMPEKTPDSFTVRKGKEAEYQAFKETSASDFYTAGIMRYAERWGGMMEQQLSDGLTVAAAAVRTQHEADTEGITGYMYGWAVNMLSEFWEHGEELRQWHNQKYDYSSEGVMNPAVLSGEEETAYEKLEEAESETMSQL